MPRLARVLEWEWSSQSRTPLAALDIVLENETLHREWIAAEVDVCFASERWPPKRADQPALRGAVRVVPHGLRTALGRSVWGGLGCLRGLPVPLAAWRECERRLPEYRAKFDLPTNAPDFCGAPQAVAERLRAHARPQFPRQAPASHRRCQQGAGTPAHRRATARRAGQH